MTVLPVDVGWLIVAVFILVPALTYLATIEANHHYSRASRKDMRDREQSLNQRAVKILEREQAVFERELSLGRRAHDAATQIHMALTEHDTEVSTRFEL